MSCFSQSSNDQVASKVMLSDVEGQKVVSPASVQPSGNRHIRPWVVVAAIAVACVVIGVAVGVPVGLAVNKNSKQSSPQQNSEQVRGVNTSALSLHLQDATTDAVNALNAAFRHLTTEAIHESYSWEGYLLARERVAAALPSVAIVNAVESDMSQFMQLLAQADLYMIDNSDVDATYEQLQPVTVASQAALAEAGSLMAGTSTSTPTPALVLQRLQGLLSGPFAASLAGNARSGTNELVIMDLHQSLLSMAEILEALPSSNPMLAPIRASLLSAVSTVTPFAQEGVDLWFTKEAKAENCDEHIENERAKCDIELSELQAGKGCTAGPDCSSKVGMKQAECARKVQEHTLKCSNRRTFIKVCGNEYEAKLAECRAGLPTNAEPAVLLQRQWECSASADTTRNLCIHRAEYGRKCAEDVDKRYTECMARANTNSMTCGAQNATVMSTCATKEAPNRLECSVSRRMDEMRKCRSVEDTGRALCTGLLPNQERYMQCMAAHDIDVVDCKFKIEAEMKKCEEEIPCKDAEQASMAACQAELAAATQQAGGNATALAAVAAAHSACDNKAKADGETCRAGANTKVQKWLTEQKASNKVVNTVRRYHEYLPYSLLVQAQRDQVASSLAALASALQAGAAAAA